MSTTNQVTARDVVWYIPNKIGYMRVITAIISFMTMRDYPFITMFVYGISCLLDALDGTMARKYGQVSRLGAVLDMVTDRSTTSGLMCFLAFAYPSRKWCVFFQVLLGLDISSHYMHMYANLSGGQGSHKNVSKESSRLLHLYYTRRDVLFTICAFNEVFYGGLYFLAFPEYATAGKWLCIVCLPGYIFKQVTNVIQLKRAALMLAELDAKDANERNKKN